MSQHRVSMADVAREAGVSAQTVSRVANGSARVDPATRARVEAAMSALGYRMNRAARALRTGRSHTLGVVVASLATAGNSLMLEAVNHAAESRGYALAIATIGPDGVDGAFARLRDQDVDGVIVLNEASAVARSAALPQGMRLLVVDSPADSRYSVIETDHFGGGRAATEYLLELGHRTVHHLAGPSGSYAATERERGWRAALADAGSSPPPLVRGAWTAASGYAAANELDLEFVTALFVANDQMALGALRALAEAGRRVPDQVSVIGFDDVDDAENYQPPLTTVRQYFDELGKRAVSALVAAIEQGEPMPQRSLVPALVAMRASTAPYRG